MDNKTRNLLRHKQGARTSKAALTILLATAAARYASLPEARSRPPEGAVLPRCVEPEWGDQIPAGDPLAQRLRRDLQRINALAMSDRLLADALLRHCSGEPPRTILDLGSGDGTVMARLAQRLAPRWKRVTIILLDRQDFVSPETRAAFATLGWTVETITDDVFHFLRQAKPGIDVITTNAFLHHFHGPQLSELLALAASTSRLIVAIEPRRTRFCLRLSWWVWVLGVSSVFRQDLRTSIKAGFKHQELSTFMAKAGGWTTEESDPSAFMHLFVAKRHARESATAAWPPKMSA